MKKFIIAITAVFVIVLSCKKIDEGNGGGLCACSPIQYVPYLNLVIKNAAGEDLLNTATTGSFDKSKIMLYAKDVNGVEKQINFNIQPPLTYGTEKLNYYQLLSSEIAVLTKSVDQIFYLKLDSKVYEVNLQVNSGLAKVEKVLIDKKEVPKETGKIATEYGISVFYLNI